MEFGEKFMVLFSLFDKAYLERYTFCKYKKEKEMQK